MCATLAGPVVVVLPTATMCHVDGAALLRAADDTSAGVAVDKITTDELTTRSNSPPLVGSRRLNDCVSSQNRGPADKTPPLSSRKHRNCIFQMSERSEGHLRIDSGERFLRDSKKAHIFVYL